MDTSRLVGAYTLGMFAVLLTSALAQSDYPPAVPLNVSAWVGKRVLFVTAHPDDIECFSGGLVGQLRAQNISTHYLVATNGDKGGQCYNATRPNLGPLEFRDCETEELAFVRRNEMVDAAKFLGVTDVSRFSLQDGMMPSYDETLLRMRMSVVIRRVRPHVIVTHYPFANWRAPPSCNGQCPGENTRWGDLGYHPDHKKVGQLVFDTAYGSGSVAANRHAFAELAEAGLPFWKADELFFSAENAAAAAPPFATHFLPLGEEPFATNAQRADAAAEGGRAVVAPVAVPRARAAGRGHALDRRGDLGGRRQGVRRLLRRGEGYMGWY